VLLFALGDVELQIHANDANMRNDANKRIYGSDTNEKYSRNSYIDLQHLYRVLGFTLIELILYIGMVAIFITGAVYFAWDLSYGREKAYQNQIVDQNARSVIARISYEIRNADDIISVSPSNLVLASQGSLTTISLSGDVIQIEPGGHGPYNLSSNQVRVTNLSFDDLGASLLDPNGYDSKNIEVSMVFEQAQPAAPQQLVAKSEVVQSIELNSQFNQAREMLVDLTNASLVSNTSIEGITIKNSSGNDITVNKMIISWQGTTSSENVAEVQIDGGAVEWSGSLPSGSELDLNDYTLSASNTVDIDYIDFDSDLSGATVDLRFIFSDSSTAKSNLELPIAVSTGTPTPTLTPTPTSTPTPSQNTCSSYCTTNGYSLGTCRKNAKDCDNNGEIYESGGDSYCTGGPLVDTCCCLP
jgi:type II secretory pathway pseudopilin PulG